MTTGRFYPSYSFISSITLGQKTVVGFEEEHDFTLGEVVSFRVPKACGTFEINNLEATVIALTSSSITVAIDSTNWTPFFDGGPFLHNPAMVVPSSSGIVPDSNPKTMNIVDAFDDIPVD